MGIKERMRDYQWKNPALKRRYQVFDFGALALAVGILLLMKFVPEPMPYIWGTVAVIVIFEWYCFKIKKQDKVGK